MLYNVHVHVVSYNFAKVCILQLNTRTYVIAQF